MNDYASSSGAVAASTPDRAARRRHRAYPTLPDLRAGARRRLPFFAFAYADGGAGGDAGIRRNWAAFDAVTLTPQCGTGLGLPSLDTTLFGTRYAAPFGIAPIGGASLAWPGAEIHFAQAAQAARIPYVLGVAGSLSIEAAARIAPDVLWFQLYRFARDDHRVGFDLVHRAAAAGAKALVLTLDVPVRTVRPREAKAGIDAPFRLDAHKLGAMLASPGWLAALARNGIPRFGALVPYAGAGRHASTQFAKREMGGSFTWDEVARYRNQWRGPLVVKGVLAAEDARRAVAIGVDGIVVSNHGGRQSEILPTSIEALPDIAAAVGGRATLLIDSGLRSGTDVVRATSAGADGCLLGKTFLWSLGALGAAGPAHAIEILRDEARATLAQLGVEEPASLRVRSRAVRSS